MYCMCVCSTYIVHIYMYMYVHVRVLCCNALCSRNVFKLHAATPLGHHVGLFSSSEFELCDEDSIFTHLSKVSTIPFHWLHATIINHCIHISVGERSLRVVLQQHSGTAFVSRQALQRRTEAARKCGTSRAALQRSQPDCRQHQGSYTLALVQVLLIIMFNSSLPDDQTMLECILYTLSSHCEEYSLTAAMQFAWKAFLCRAFHHLASTSPQPPHSDQQQGTCICITGQLPSTHVYTKYHL